MPQWLRANLLLAGLFSLTALLLFLAHWVGSAWGLLPEERRYLLAITGVVAVVTNYVIAKRALRAVTRGTINRP